jgi:hypothetical protein
LAHSGTIEQFGRDIETYPESVREGGSDTGKWVRARTNFSGNSECNDDRSGIAEYVRGAIGATEM